MLGNLTLTLCLTHQCNLRCRYCYAGRKYDVAMPSSTLERAIDIALAEVQTGAKMLDISFFGGEPLLEVDLLQHGWHYASLQAAKLGIKIRFSLTTNGILLSDEIIQWLAERDFLVGLSVDGSPEMHDINRRFEDGRGSHEYTSAALSQIIQRRGLRHKIICVVNPANHHLLCEGAQWLVEHGAGIIGFNFDYWSKWNDLQFASLAEQLKQLAGIVTQSYRSGSPIRIECFENKIRTALVRKEAPCNVCRMGEREIAVSVDGNFFPCSRLVGVGDRPEFNFGNVRDGINRAKQNMIIATRGNATPECRVCALKHRCLNTCGCTNYATSGAINRVSPFLCQLEQLLIQLSDEIAETLYLEQNESFFNLFYKTRQ